MGVARAGGHRIEGEHILNRIIRRLLVGLVVLACLGLACAAGLMGFVYYKETHLPPVGDSDVIIVLGAQVKEDGTPSVALTRRLTAALESYLEKPQLIIVCGAQGINEPRADAIFVASTMRVFPEF